MELSSICEIGESDASRLTTLSVSDAEGPGPDSPFLSPRPSPRVKRACPSLPL